jgi:hypothetical protein
MTFRLRLGEIDFQSDWVRHLGSLSRGGILEAGNRLMAACIHLDANNQEYYSLLLRIVQMGEGFAFHSHDGVLSTISESFIGVLLAECVAESLALPLGPRDSLSAIVSEEAWLWRRKHDTFFFRSQGTSSSVTKVETTKHLTWL